MSGTYQCDGCSTRLVQLATCVYRCPWCRTAWWVKRAQGGGPVERANLYDLPYPAGQAIAYLVEAMRERPAARREEG